jgi:hypothetical protein
MGGPGGPFRSRRLAAKTLVLISSGALIAATPGPSVSLDTLLAPPPTGYAADVEANGTPLGPFSATEYAGFVQADNTQAAASALSRDGFVAGYAGSWTEQTSGRGLVELVVAFSGGAGARSWLGTAQAAARASDYYKGAIPVAGVGPYYGVRYANPTVPSYADVVSFVKGNDFFTVGFVSSTDDLGAAAATQAKKQFDAAPPDSIPPAQWPENLSLLAGGIDSVKVVLLAAVGIVVVGFAVSLALFLYVRRTGGKLSLDGESRPPDG